jgi:hypothetical protein
MGNVNMMVFERFLATYDKPKTENEDQFYDEWEAAVGFFDDEVLTAAADQTIRYHVYKSWPTIGEFYDRCVRVADATLPKARPEDNVPQWERDWVEPSPEEKVRVAEMAKQVIENLNEFSRKNVIEEKKAGRFARTSRPDFEAMQRNSRNGMHDR